MELNKFCPPTVSDDLCLFFCLFSFFYANAVLVYLGFVELKGGGYLYAPGPGEVLVEVELLLQLRQLLGGEVGPARVVDAAGPGTTVESLRFGG